jgi:hypothetical protein
MEIIWQILSTLSVRIVGLSERLVHFYITSHSKRQQFHSHRSENLEFHSCEKIYMFVDAVWSAQEDLNTYSDNGLHNF